MKCTLLITIVISAALANSSLGAFCNYYQSSNRVTCGQVTCSTAIPNAGHEKTPVGTYYVGESRIHKGVGWFNLYPKRAAGGYWDYYTKVPEFNCRGYFGLHAGTVSEGCITVTDTNCFNQLRDEITNNFPVIPFNVYKCRLCGWPGGCFSTPIVKRPCTSDLQVHSWSCASCENIPADQLLT